MAQAVIGSLRVNLAANTAAFDDAMKGVDKQMKGFKASMATMGAGIRKAMLPLAASGGAIAGVATIGARAAKEFQKLSGVAGAGFEEFQRAAFAANSVGVPQEKLADIFKDVNDKIGDFLATGGGELKDFFETVAPQVGVTAEAFRNLSGPQALQKFATTLQQAGKGQKEMTFFLESLANDATLLAPLLADGGTEFQRLGEEAGKYGILGEGAASGAQGMNEAFAAINQSVNTLGAALAESGILDALAKIIKAVAEGIANLSTNISDGTARIKEFTDRTGEVVDSVKGMVADIKTTIVSLPEDLKQLGSDIVEGLKSGIQEKWQEFIGWWNTQVDNLPDFFAKRMRIQSPSRLFRDFGRYIVEGLTLGIGDQSGALRSAVQAMGAVVEDVGSTITGSLKSALSTGKTDFEDFADTLASISERMRDRMLNEAFKPIEDAINGLVGSLASGLTGGAGGDMGSIFSAGIGSLLSFEGGGFTGLGARTGGIDGMGGFPAILHPNETVIDHTRGKTQGGAAANVTVQVITRDPDTQVKMREGGLTQRRDARKALNMLG